MPKVVQQQIGNIALVVENYDDAIDFYTKKLQFTLVEDTDLGGGKRWVQVSPPNSNGTNLLLAQASTDEQTQFIGNQTGGRVFLFLQTNDFWRDYELMKENGVVFNEAPRIEEYGTVVVFQDLYGNKWDLLQLSSDLICSSQTGHSIKRHFVVQS
ncbi:VOC family protein [Vibrio cincinnatiensis]